jgi:hypothetical protein
VNAVCLMVLHVITDQSAQMWLVHGNDVVQHLAPATSHPSFGDPILPGRTNARPFGLQTGRLQKRDYVVVELRVPIQYQVLPYPDEILLGIAFRCWEEYIACRLSAPFGTDATLQACQIRLCAALR